MTAATALLGLNQWRESIGLGEHRTLAAAEASNSQFLRRGLFHLVGDDLINIVFNLLVFAVAFA